MAVDRERAVVEPARGPQRIDFADRSACDNLAAGHLDRRLDHGRRTRCRPHGRSERQGVAHCADGGVLLSRRTPRRVTGGRDEAAGTLTHTSRRTSEVAIT